MLASCEDSASLTCISDAKRARSTNCVTSLRARFSAMKMFDCVNMGLSGHSRSVLTSSWSDIVAILASLGSLRMNSSFRIACLASCLSLSFGKLGFTVARRCMISSRASLGVTTLIYRSACILYGPKFISEYKIHVYASL